MDIKRLVIVVIVLAVFVGLCAYLAPAFNSLSFDQDAVINNEDANIFGDGGLVPSLFVDKHVENKTLDLVNEAKKLNDSGSNGTLKNTARYFIATG